MKSKRRTIDKEVITCLVIIAVIIGFVAYAFRAVLFRPWTARSHIAGGEEYVSVALFPE